MIKLIKRCPEFVDEYKLYCQEAFDHHVKYFVPKNPSQIDEGWFERTKTWYDKKERGEIQSQPAGFHFWAVDGDKFIGEFQLRTEYTDEVLNGIGNIGYAVRFSEQSKGYGTQILQQGLRIAQSFGMKKVYLNINWENQASIHLCEKLGGTLVDKIEAYNKAEGQHIMCRYLIFLVA